MGDEPKANVLVFSFPIQGHINPLLQFSKRLISKNVTVTFLTTSSTHNNIIRRAVAGGATALPLSFVPLDDGFEEGHSSTDSSPEYFAKFQENVSRSLSQLISSMEPKPNAVVYDSCTPWILDVCREHPGVSAASFFTQCSTVNAIYVHFLRGAFKEFQNDVVLPGMPPLKGSDLPVFLYDNNLCRPLFELLCSQFCNVGDIDFFLVNSFDQLEVEGFFFYHSIMDYSNDDGMVDTDSSEESLLSDNEVDSDYELIEQDMDNASTSKRSQISYLVLKEQDIRKHQRTDIERVSTVLSISQVEAIVLLLHYQWNVSKIEDEWFTDEEKVRELVGILKEPVVDVNNDLELNIIECGICFESYPQMEIKRVSCGHPYCNDCWTGYITTTINDGPGCLVVKCPEPSCSAVACQDMIDEVIADKEVKEKYYSYFVRSYVEASGNKIKWCPSPGCEYAVDFESGSGSEHYDVSCLCSYEFCWNCGEDAHRPVDCDTVSKWISKNSNESENTNWILANTKPCPKCKRQIEKNMGCNHMRCSICKHSFCWNCLCPLSGHKDCHKFRDDNETDAKKQRAKRAIDRYMHYYERWASNQSSRLIAMEDLKKLESVQLKKLSFRQCTTESQLQFTIEAWHQIIECRRVLKWTYAYGYYLPEEEETKKQFFEYLQGEAEAGLERLHHCAEEELKHFVNKTQDSTKNFNEFRNKLTGLTEATKTYFENLVKALENGLADVALNESSKSETKSISPTKRRKLK